MIRHRAHLGACLVLVTVVAAIGAGCGAGHAAGSGSTSTATSTQAVSDPPASQPPAIDHDVVRWKKRWHLKILSPINQAIRILNANAVAAAGGDSSASYRLTGAFDTLDNCRVRLHTPPLQPTPGGAAGRAQADAARVPPVLHGRRRGDPRTERDGCRRGRCRPEAHQRGHPNAERRDAC